MYTSAENLQTLADRACKSVPSEETQFRLNRARQFNRDESTLHAGGELEQSSPAGTTAALSDLTVTAACCSYDSTVA